MRLFVAGDTHGNTAFITDYLYPQAAKLRADVIVQCGDFGYWEHEDEGVDFIDAVADAACQHGIPLCWLRGNHDKVSLALARYGHQRTDAGFIRLRPDLYHIPDGLVWTWAGVRLRAFGGAYSVDKFLRLEEEARRQRKALYVEDARRRAGRPAKASPTFAETLWFPEEEMTDEAFAALLAADSGPLDVVFSHDKPRGSNPGLPLKDEPACLPNQDRLQRALLAHQPQYWLHGHLHHAYTDRVRCDDDRWTTVIGLAPDDRAAQRFWRPTQSWCLLEFGDGMALTHTDGDAADMDAADMDVATDLRKSA